MSAKKGKSSIEYVPKPFSYRANLLKKHYLYAMFFL